MPKIRIVCRATIRAVEHRLARQWKRGLGKDAEFSENSEGWYAMLNEFPGSVFLGDEDVDWRAGDRLRITVERES
jgi:hypothetical protein